MLAATLIALACLPAAVDDLEEIEASWEDAKDAEDRIEVLDRASALYRTAPADSGVTEFVLSALMSRHEHEVRIHAATLLGAGFDADIAIEWLLGGIDDATDEVDELAVEVAEINRKLKREVDSKNPNFAVLMELLSEELSAIERTKGVDDLRVAIGQALARRRDDRCATGIGELLPDVLHREESLDLVDVLLGYGTQPAVGAVVSTFEGIDGLRDRRKDTRKRLAKEKAKPKPPYYSGNATEWRKSERTRLKKRLDDFDEQTEELEKRLVTIAKRASAFAKANGLQKAPRNARKTTWGGWWERNREQLPESLQGS